MLVRQQPTALRRSTRELADALADAHGDRFAVWHTDELLFGVQGGRLVLRTLGGAELPAPDVVCVRQVAGPMRDDREVTLLRHLERMGSTLVNGVGAHLNSRNKIWQLQELALAGLPVPDTLSYATAPLEGVVHSLGTEGACVVKTVSGSKGTQVFLAPDARMLRAVAGSLQQDVPFLFQEHVAHSHGRTLRVIVVYVLDEFAYLLHWGWVDVDEVVAVLRDRPGTQHVVITGRNAPEKLVEYADLVTDMSKVKHPMDAGQKGQRGIEW
ncbi:cob(I)yrinic acid a,c-diamide adenosyltransferase [Streptomyces spectabilis]